MRNFTAALCCLVAAALGQGCSDDIETDDIESYVEYTVVCNNPNAEFHVDGTNVDPKGVYSRGTYRNESKTKDYFAVVDVKCTDDPKALIEVTLFINHKKKGYYNGNERVFVSERLKGKGPYLK